MQFSLDETFDTGDEIVGRMAEQTSYRRQPLPAGSSALLRVRSVSGTGETPLRSEWSAPVAGMTMAPQPPAVPTGVTVSGSGDDFIEWSWTPVEGADGYEVQFSLDEIFSEEDEIVVRTAAETSYGRPSLPPGASGFLRVRSFTGTGEARLWSEWSASVAGMTLAPQPPTTPTGLRISASGSDFIEWRWNPVEGANGYEVQLSLEETFDAGDEIVGRMAEQTSYRRQPLPAGSSALLRVRSVSRTGETPLRSEWSAPVAGMTMAPQPPAVPTGVTVSGSGDDFIEWSWTPVEGADGYEVQFSLDEIFSEEDEIVVRTAAETSYGRPSLPPGASGFLRVRSFTGTGETRLWSEWSASVAGMTLAPQPPTTPTGLRISASGSDFIEWRWNPVEGADGYDVQFSLDERFDSTDEIIGRTADQTSYRRQPLPAETSASLRVRSASGSGDGRITSDWSTPVTGMTPEPPIKVTPVGRGISVTSESQILLELMPEDVVPANPLDLAGRTVVFTPDGRGTYSRSERDLAWEEDLGDPVDDNAEIGFRFDFAGREWGSFFVSRYGLVTFGEPYPFSQLGPDRWGTMAEIAEHLGAPPVIAALYKPRLGGWSTYDAEQFGNTQHVSRRPDRVVVTWITTDAAFHVHGVPPQEKTRFQMALHTDGGIAFHYAPEPDDPDEAIRDGIVGLFPGAVKTGLLGSIPDSVDGSVPAHLDLVETALYATAESDRVLVEFTTRGPIRPIPNQEIFYIVVIDDWDFFAGVALQPDGSRTARWDAEAAYDRDVDDNRIGLLFDSGEFSGHSTSVLAFAQSRNTVTGSWGPRYGEHSAVISFPEVIASAPTDLSEPGSSAAAREVFHHTGVKDHLVPIGCRVIETLGDEFDAIFLHSQFRYDIQFSGSWWGYYPGNVPIRGIGFPERLDERKSPCGTRLRGQWGFAIWTKSDFVAVEDNSGRLAPGPEGTWHLAHEFTHTWAARASYLRDGEIEPVWGGGTHWLPGLHTPAAFARTGSIMGGDFWRENADGTFTRVVSETKSEEGLSWLDLYLSGLATADEVPDTFLLRNLQETGRGWRGPHTAEKEIVTMEQVLAALGPRDPPPGRSQKVFNIGFVYLLEPGQEPDQDQLRFHALFLDGVLDYWARITGGRSRLTTEFPPR